MEILSHKAKAAVEMARANLLQAEVAWKRANREYDRLLKLKEVGLVTQQNLDDGADREGGHRSPDRSGKGSIEGDGGRSSAYSDPALQNNHPSPRRMASFHPGGSMWGTW